jgi:hypothetical protein
MTAQPAPGAPTAAAPANGTADDVRMARVHLRLGQLVLARAELEDMFRQDVLDTASLAVLAEARWRTGDGAGAAGAAQAHLDAGGSDDVALCIAAEAAAADGRPADARSLMDRLPASDAAALDALFAGMPRRAFWPAAPIERGRLDELHRETEGRPVGPPRRSTAARQPTADAPTEAYGYGALAGGEVLDARAVPGPREVIGATGIGAPRGVRAAGEGPDRTAGAGGRAIRTGARRIKGQLDPVAELARARTELETRPDRAFLRLALVLRHDPTLAPSVLDVLHLRREPTAALLRGDAQRLLGRHLEAEAAFDAAADSLEAS